MYNGLSYLYLLFWVDMYDGVVLISKLGVNLKNKHNDNSGGNK